MERPAGASKRCGHIEKHYYYVQDKIKTRMKLAHIDQSQMIADILTKPLGGTKFKEFRDFILHDLPDEVTLSAEEVVLDTRTIRSLSS
jgi:hypothetical protein